MLETLLENDIKFNNNPQSEVEISCAATNSHWEFEIFFNGIGIEEKYQVKNSSNPVDWSAAVFFFVMAALKTNQPIHLKNLKSNSFQGDEKLLDWIQQWGVECKVVDDGLVVEGKRIPTREFECDFTNTPDLAQAFAVMAAVSNRRLLLNGLSTLIGKETNRLLALKTELEKAGA